MSPHAPHACVFTEVQTAGNKIWVFCLLLGVALCMQCEGMSLLGHNTGSEEVQANCPVLTFMHFGALSLLLSPVNPYQRLLPDNSVRNIGGRGVGIVKLL